VHLIENANCVATENYGIFLDRAITQLDVFYQATLFDLTLIRVTSPRNADLRPY